MLDEVHSVMDVDAAHREASRGWVSPPTEPDDGVLVVETRKRSTLRKRLSKPAPGDMDEIKTWGGQRTGVARAAIEDATKPGVETYVLRGSDGDPIAVASVVREADTLKVAWLGSAPGGGNGTAMMQELAKVAQKDGLGIRLVAMDKTSEPFYEKLGMAKTSSVGEYSFTADEAAVFARTGGYYPPLGSTKPSGMSAAQNIALQEVTMRALQNAGPASATTAEAVRSALTAQLNPAAFERGGVSMYIGLATDTAQAAGQISLDHLGIDRTFAWAHTENTARAEYSVRGSKVIQNLYGDHVEKLTKTIVEATDPRNPLTIAETRKRIAQEWPQLKTHEVDRIARTETATVWTNTAANTYEANGIGQFETIVASGPQIGVEQEDPCMICIDAAAEVYGITDDPPPWHPSCRCEMVPILESDGEPWLPPDEPWTGGGAGSGPRAKPPRPMPDLPPRDMPMMGLESAVPGGHAVGDRVQFDYLGQNLEGSVAGRGVNDPARIQIEYSRSPTGNPVYAEVVPERVRPLQEAPTAAEPPVVPAAPPPPPPPPPAPTAPPPTEIPAPPPAAEVARPPLSPDIDVATRDGLDAALAHFQGETVRVTVTGGRKTSGIAREVRGQWYVGPYRFIRHDSITGLEVKLGGRFKDYREFDRLSADPAAARAASTPRPRAAKTPDEIPDGGFKFDDAPPSGRIGVCPKTPEFKSVAEAQAFAEEFIAHQVYLGANPDLRGLQQALDGMAKVQRPFGVKLDRLQVEKPRGKALAVYGTGTRRIMVDGKKTLFNGNIIQAQNSVMNARQMATRARGAQEIYDANKLETLAGYERAMERWREKGVQSEIDRTEKAIARTKGTSRWYVASEVPDQATESLMAHEAGHALDAFFKNASKPGGLRAVFGERIVANGVEAEDTWKISEYGYTGGREAYSELWAEVTALRAVGRDDLIPEPLLKAYDETLASITREEINDLVAATRSRHAAVAKAAPVPLAALVASRVASAPPGLRRRARLP